MKNKKVDLFLDSGAFSAFTKGAPIDIKEYIKFIKKYEKDLTVYANLDVIGDAEGTLKNQKIMEKAGLKPLPCFHYGEPTSYLKHYVENYKYIALGGMVPISTGDLMRWLDELFSLLICDKKGIPKVKVHGFGLTSLPLMLRYPWYSVDSTSWVVTGRLGAVYVPRYKSGKWIYNENSLKVSVSTRSPSKKEEDQHIDTMSPHLRQLVLEYFKMKGYVLGTSEFKTVSAKKYELKKNERWSGKAIDDEREVEITIKNGLCNDYKLRDELNIMYFMDLEKSIAPYPQPFTIKKNLGFGL